MHPGDITIADYWGIEKAAPEFDDNKGITANIDTLKADLKEKKSWRR